MNEDEVSLDVKICLEEDPCLIGVISKKEGVILFTTLSINNNIYMLSLGLVFRRTMDWFIS